MNSFIQVSKTATVAFILLFSLSAFSQSNSQKIMTDTAEQSQDSISEGHEYATGVVFSAIGRTPKFSRELVSELKRIEAEEVNRLVHAVEENSEDFNCTPDEARKDIRKCIIGSRAIAISERFVAKLNGRIVGYAIALDNNADAAIIQDGSWIMIYLDINMRPVAVFTGQG